MGDFALENSVRNLSEPTGLGIAGETDSPWLLGYDPLGGALFLGLSIKKLRLDQPISPARQNSQLAGGCTWIASSRCNVITLLPSAGRPFGLGFEGDAGQLRYRKGKDQPWHIPKTSGNALRADLDTTSENRS